MTEETPKNLEAVVKNLDVRKKVNELNSKRPDNRYDKKDNADKEVREAQEKLREMAIDFLYKDKVLEDFDTDTKPEDVNDEVINKALEVGLFKLKEEADKRFYTGLDSIVDSEIPDEALDRLLKYSDERGQPILASRTDEKSRKILNSYLTLDRFKQFRSYYEKKGEPRDDEEKQIVDRAIVQGAVLAQRERSKNMSKEYQALAEQLAGLAARYGYVKKDKQREYTLKGIDETIKQIEESYKEAGDYKEVVRNTLKNMARKGSREDYETALSLVYSAVTDKKEKKDMDESDESENYELPSKIRNRSAMRRAA